jgi:hypothetical protein
LRPGTEVRNRRGYQAKLARRHDATPGWWLDGGGWIQDAQIENPDDDPDGGWYLVNPTRPRSVDLTPGTRLRNGKDVRTLDRRKTQDDARMAGSPGWWCREGGGLADFVIDGEGSHWTIEPDVTPLRRSADLRPGTRIRWRNNKETTTTLARRKTPDDKSPLSYRPGWWLEDSGGIADDALDNPEEGWTIVDEPAPPATEIEQLLMEKRALEAEVRTLRRALESVAKAVNGLLNRP